MLGSFPRVCAKSLVFFFFCARRPGKVQEPGKTHDMDTGQKCLSYRSWVRNITWIKKKWGIVTREGQRSEIRHVKWIQDSRSMWERSLSH